MEIAELLGRTPRQALDILTHREFVAYAKLGADRSDEVNDEKGVDWEEASPEGIASMFGAKIA